MSRPHKYPKKKKLLKHTPCFSQIKGYSNQKSRFIPIDWSGCMSQFSGSRLSISFLHNQLI